MSQWTQLILLLTVVATCLAYWDTSRENEENPKHGISDSNCDHYCRLLPPYINWREGFNSIEREMPKTVMSATEHGSVQGFSVPGLHDISSFVNIYLGIPYAKPVAELGGPSLGRFKVGQLPIYLLSLASSLCHGNT